jgi:hypothetical protein
MCFAVLQTRERALTPCSFVVFNLGLTFESTKELENASIDAYKNTYYEGDEVIQGRWYDLFRPRSWTYLFNDDSEPTYMYSHLVCALKFIMPPTSHNIRGNYLSFELPTKTCQLIEETLEDLRLLDGDLPI